MTTKTKQSKNIKTTTSAKTTKSKSTANRSIKTIKSKPTANHNAKTAKSKPIANLSTTKLTTWGKIWRAILCITAPLLGGFLISLLSRNAMDQFGMLKQPPLAPPAWLFPVAWTILYILMGIASYLICLKSLTGNKAERHKARTALIVYAVQLVLNFIWTPIFFNANLYWPALVVLLVMWLLEIILLIMTFKLSKPAFWCLLPYLLWTSFAAYLNISIAILN